MVDREEDGYEFENPDSLKRYLGSTILQTGTQW